MLKIAMIVGAMAVGLMPAAYAQGMKCDDASMTKMKTDMDANTMATKDQKDMAMKEMKMAMDSMKANKMDDCAMHMGKAQDAMMKK